MVYGMTVRYPWGTEGVTCDPRDIWKIWDEFGIDKSVMKGYWDSTCPVKTNNPDVLATAYVRKGEKGKMLISVASWASSTTDVRLQIDWKSIGINPDKALITVPYIKNFQEIIKIAIHDTIRLSPAKGLLILVE